MADQGEGGEEYGDPAAFFRITYATEGLRRGLAGTIARLAGRGGELVMGPRPTSGAARPTPCSRSITWPGSEQAWVAVVVGGVSEGGSTRKVDDLVKARERARSRNLRFRVFAVNSTSG